MKSPFIIDLSASNWLLHQLTGDTQTLTGAASFQRITVSEGEELLISEEDLVQAFYLFGMPDCWSPFMILAKPVPGRFLGRPEAAVPRISQSWRGQEGKKKQCLFARMQAWPAQNASRFEAEDENNLWHPELEPHLQTFFTNTNRFHAWQNY